MPSFFPHRLKDADVGVYLSGGWCRHSGTDCTVNVVGALGRGGGWGRNNLAQSCVARKHVARKQRALERQGMALGGWSRACSCIFSRNLKQSPQTRSQHLGGSSISAETKGSRTSWRCDARASRLLERIHSTQRINLPPTSLTPPHHSL